MSAKHPCYRLSRETVRFILFLNFRCICICTYPSAHCPTFPTATHINPIQSHRQVTHFASPDQRHYISDKEEPFKQRRSPVCSSCRNKTYQVTGCREGFGCGSLLSLATSLQFGTRLPTHTSRTSTGPLLNNMEQPSGHRSQAFPIRQMIVLGKMTCETVIYV